MSLFVVDVEADGPCPGPYSMVSFGAVRIDDKLDTTYYGTLRPISFKYVPEALAVSGVTREMQLTYPDPKIVMPDFLNWVKRMSTGAPVFVSDNPAFDWQFINYYAHVFADGNPFGHSARRVGDFFAGLQRAWLPPANWRQYAKSPLTHHPVEDALSVAQALQGFCEEHRIVLPV